MPEKFDHPALFGLWFLALLIWQFTAPALAQAPAQSGLDPNGSLFHASKMNPAAALSDITSKKILILHSLAYAQPVYKIIDEPHKFYIIGGLVFIVAQALLIAGPPINKRRRTSAKGSLRKKTEDLDQFFNVTLDLLCIANTDGYFLRLNPAWERILGYSHEELMAKQFIDFVHPDDLERTRQAVSTLASQEKVTSFENRYRCKDGTYRWFEWTATPDGNLIYAGARDITEHKLAQQALEERLRFERLLSDLSAVFVHIPPDRVDSEIEQGLKQILDFFKVDRCGLVRILPGKGSWQITHLAFSKGVPEIPVSVELPTLTHPWVYHKLIEKREIVSVSNFDDLPPEANVDKQTWIKWGIRSTLHIPILIVGGVGHVISLNSVRSPMIWRDELFPRLQLLGEIFVNAQERKHLRLEINERLRFERLISELSASFVNLPYEKVGGEIYRGLRSITEFFDADRCSIGLFSEDRNLIERVSEYVTPGAEPASESISKEQMPWYLDQLAKGNPVVFSRIEDLPPEAEKERRVCLLKSMKSVLSVPLVSGGKSLGSCALVATRAERVWPEELVHRFRLLTEVFGNALKRKKMEEQLRENLREIENLKLRLEHENIYLQEEIKLLGVHTEIVGQSLAMKKILAQAEEVARTDSSVLITGETGTGKELVARAIHSMSRRNDRLMITVNCASLPPTLIESELFGRERGAYTGALTKMVGRFEVADGSTLFLDEIGELPLDVQSKLLRVLEAGSFERLGSTKTLHANVRIIAATNRDVGEDVRAGRFRKDLYYRLNVFPIAIPPLRERPEDIPLMVTDFVGKLQKKMGKEIKTISKKTMHALQSYSWPGNVRELKNIIEHAMILSKDNTLVVRLPDAGLWETNVTQNLYDMERVHVVSVLEKAGWRVSGKGGAAETLGLKRTTLEAKMKKLGIKRPNK